MGYIWDIYGIYMGYIWDIYGIYMGYIYIYGIYMGYIWDIYGIYMGYTWYINIYGIYIYMGYIWDIYGIYIWDIYMGYIYIDFKHCSRVFLLFLTLFFTLRLQPWKFLRQSLLHGPVEVTTSHAVGIPKARNHHHLLRDRVAKEFSHVHTSISQGHWQGQRQISLSQKDLATADGVALTRQQSG